MTGTGATSAPEPEASSAPGQSAYGAHLDELFRPVKGEVDRLRGELHAAAPEPSAVPLPPGEYARQLERQLAEAGRELIRLASAERDAREGRELLIGVLGKIRAAQYLHAGGALDADVAMRQVGEAIDALKDAEGGETETEWAVFYGGPDPENCAGRETMPGQAMAEHAAQWRICSGIARRTVSYGPWEVMTGEDDGTKAVPETEASDG